MLVPIVSSAQIQPTTDEIPSSKSIVATTPNTGMENPPTKSLTTAFYDPKTVSTLQNIYFFSEKEVQEVSAFAKAIQEVEPKLYADVKPKFLDKIKALCAKILGFFGNGSKSVQLHGEGIAIFNEFKTYFLSPEHRDFTLKFIDENIGNPEVIKGFGRIFGLEISGDIKSSRDFYTQLMNPQLLKALPDVKKLLEQVVLPMSKEEVQALLKENLKKPSKGGKDWTDVYGPNSVIFKDMDRNFAYRFHIDGKTIEIGPFESSSGQELAYQKFEDAIKDLPKDMQEKLREFCKNFPSQGVFAFVHPRTNGAGRIDCGKTQFDVYFQDDVSVHVDVLVGGKKPVNVPCWDGRNRPIVAKTFTEECGIGMDYYPSDGHSSNIDVKSYSGQTVTIDLKAQNSM